MKIHLIFNTDRLKLYYEDVPTEQKVNSKVVEEIEEWEVKKIRKKKKDRFLVKWRGFTKPTWKLKQNLTHYDEVIRKWIKQGIKEWIIEDDWSYNINYFLNRRRKTNEKRTGETGKNNEQVTMSNN